MTQAGPEIAVPATKTYTTQWRAGCRSATALGAERRVDADLARVPDAVAALLPTDVSAAVEALAAADEVVVSGRGLLLGTALETALKLEETCLRPVRGYSYADLRHGPISVVTDGVLAVLVAASDGPLAGPMVELADDLRDAGCPHPRHRGHSRVRRPLRRQLPGPDLPEVVAPMASIVPAQLTIERLARDLGIDPDNPRGLDKVTQTDAP